MATCPCGCAATTTRLFAPGHDSRYKGMLRAGTFSSPYVVWNDEKITIDDAIDRIAAAIGSDWSAVPSGGKPRPANVSSAPRPASTASERSETPPKPAKTPSARRPTRRSPSVDHIEELMSRLENRGPVVGAYGWYRPPHLAGTRYIARVHRTFRDQGSSKLNLFLPAEDTVVTDVDPASFFVDPMAKP